MIDVLVLGIFSTQEQSWVARNGPGPMTAFPIPRTIANDIRCHNQWGRLPFVRIEFANEREENEIAIVICSSLPVCPTIQNNYLPV